MSQDGNINLLNVSWLFKAHDLSAWFYLNKILQPWKWNHKSRDEWSSSRPCHFTSRERVLGTNWTGRWVDLSPGLDNTEKLEFLTTLRLEPGPLSHPARSQPLYRLSYHSSLRFPSVINELSTWQVLLFTFYNITFIQFSRNATSVMWHKK
jgi:hypothetical protein